MLPQRPPSMTPEPRRASASQYGRGCGVSVETECASQPAHSGARPRAPRHAERPPPTAATHRPTGLGAPAQPSQPHRQCARCRRRSRRLALEPHARAEPRRRRRLTQSAHASISRPRLGEALARLRRVLHAWIEMPPRLRDDEGALTRLPRRLRAAHDRASRIAPGARKFGYAAACAVRYAPTWPLVCVCTLSRTSSAGAAWRSHSSTASQRANLRLRSNRRPRHPRAMCPTPLR